MPNRLDITREKAGKGGRRGAEKEKALAFPEP
jgi:hypothetical protein